MQIAHAIYSSGHVTFHIGADKIEPYAVEYSENCL